MEIDELVGSVVVVEHVRIVIGKAYQYVVSTPTLYSVFSRRPQDQIGAITANQCIRLRINCELRRHSVIVLIQQVVSQAAVGVIVSDSAHQFVVAILAAQLVISFVGEDGVVTRSAPYAIVALPGDDDVVAAIAKHVRVYADACGVQDDCFIANRSVDYDLGYGARGEIPHVRERDIFVYGAPASYDPVAPLSPGGQAIPRVLACIGSAFCSRNVLGDIRRIHDQLAVDDGQSESSSTGIGDGQRSIHRVQGCRIGVIKERIELSQQVAYFCFLALEQAGY